MLRFTFPSQPTFKPSLREGLFGVSLVKLREACLFYIKGNALALGAMITLASALKLEQKAIIEYTSSNLWFLVAAGFLIAFGLAIECSITIAVATTDPEKNEKTAKTLRKFYVTYVLLQVFGMGFFLGWTAKSLDLLSKVQ